MCFFRMTNNGLWHIAFDSKVFIIFIYIKIVCLEILTCFYHNLNDAKDKKSTHFFIVNKHCMTNE